MKKFPKDKNYNKVHKPSYRVDLYSNKNCKNVDSPKSVLRTDDL